MKLKGWTVPTMDDKEMTSDAVHPLSQWLDAEEMTVAEFRRKLVKAGVRVSRYTVDLWLLGETTPNLRNACAIEDVTGGDITMRNLATWDA